MLALTAAQRLVRDSARSLAYGQGQHRAPAVIQSCFFSKRGRIKGSPQEVNESFDLLNAIGQLNESESREKNTPRKISEEDNKFIQRKMQEGMTQKMAEEALSQAGMQTARPIVRRTLGFFEAQEFPDYLKWRMSENARVNMYKDYQEKPDFWTVKKLSEKYRISPRRVPAVIFLMQRREQYDKFCRENPDKCEPFWDFADEEDTEYYNMLNQETGMDINDMSETGNNPEPIIVAMTGASDTKFRVLNDDEVTKFYERLTEEAKRGIPKYPTPRIPDDPAKVIDVDPVFKSRTKLVFTDISKGAGGSENRDIRIREPDGTLRTPTGYERYKIERTQFPSKRNTRLL